MSEMLVGRMGTSLEEQWGTFTPQLDFKSCRVGKLGRGCWAPANPEHVEKQQAIGGSCVRERLPDLQARQTRFCNTDVDCEAPVDCLFASSGS